jgi:hypothetical protein
MWRHIDLVWTHVSEEHIASIFRVEKSRARNQREQVAADLATRRCFYWWLSLQPPVHAGSSLADFSTLKIEARCSSETSVHTRSSRRHIPEDGILHSLRSENLKFYNFMYDDGDDVYDETEN